MTDTDVLNGELKTRPRLNRWLLILGVTGLLSIPVVLFIAFHRGESRTDQIAQLVRDNRVALTKLETLAGQLCSSEESAHLRDVRQLRDTYKYLTGLSEGERRMALNRAVLAGLPGTEDQARDRAPASCDLPGVGLPEPDPVEPCRPKSIHLPKPSVLASVCGRRVETHG